MACIKVNIPGYGDCDGEAAIVILGPNGVGKTKLAQRMAQSGQVSAISAQRRTWVNVSLPVEEERQLKSFVQQQQNQWRQNSWQPTEEINHILSELIQDHSNILTKNNEQAIEANTSCEPVRDTKLILLQVLWSKLFPKRKLEIGGFFPKVTRLDTVSAAPAYQLREMSDGERTVLYMAARVLTAELPLILVDEPELHMHCRLAVQFWDEAEKLRPDCRFVYITHDLNFALSRRGATYLVARSSDRAEPLVVDNLPLSIAGEVLGAATLPFYAKRIFFFEGEPGNGFANEFFSVWFDDHETFPIPSGSRDAVCEAVSGLKKVGIVAADVMGLIDRDFYSDEYLSKVSDGIIVLELHEIESILCDPEVAKSLAAHLGMNPDETWDAFVKRVREEYDGQKKSAVVASRVRARVGNLLEGAFCRAQIDADLAQTANRHVNALSQLDIPTRAAALFAEESGRVSKALAEGGTAMLAILPGKQLLSILAQVLKLNNASALTSMVVKSLDRKHLRKDDTLSALGLKIEAALLEYLPARHT